MKVRGCEGPVGKWMEGEGVRVGRGGEGVRVGRGGREESWVASCCNKNAE